MAFGTKDVKRRKGGMNVRPANRDGMGPSDRRIAANSMSETGGLNTGAAERGGMEEQAQPALAQQSAGQGAAERGGMSAEDMAMQQTGGAGLGTGAAERGGMEEQAQPAGKPAGTVAAADLGTTGAGLGQGAAERGGMSAEDMVMQQSNTGGLNTGAAERGGMEAQAEPAGAEQSAGQETTGATAGQGTTAGQVTTGATAGQGTGTVGAMAGASEVDREAKFKELMEKRTIDEAKQGGGAFLNGGGVKMNVPELKVDRVEEYQEMPEEAMKFAVDKAANEKEYKAPFASPKTYQEVMANFEARDKWLERKAQKKERWQKILGAIIGASEIVARAMTGASGENVTGKILMDKEKDRWAKLQQERENNKQMFTAQMNRLNQQETNKLAARKAELDERRVAATERNIASQVENRAEKLAIDLRKVETAEQLATAKKAYLDLQSLTLSEEFKYLAAEKQAKIKQMLASAWHSLHPEIGKQSSVTHQYVKGANGEQVELPKSGKTVMLDGAYYNFPSTIKVSEIVNQVKGGRTLSEEDALDWMKKHITDPDYSQEIKRAIAQAPGVSVLGKAEAQAEQPAGKPARTEAKAQAQPAGAGQRANKEDKKSEQKKGSNQSNSKKLTAEERRKLAAEKDF